MNHFATFSALVGTLLLATPVTGWTKDKHRHHDHRHFDRSGGHHHHNHYRGPSVVYRSYRPSYYSGYGYGYGYPYSSYYSRPSFGLSVTTTPTYYSSARYNDDYDDDLAVDVQRALARRGYYRGGIDGEVGPGTRSAIREYQYRNRLEVTGRIDRSLLRSLDLD